MKKFLVLLLIFACCIFNNISLIQYNEKEPISCDNLKKEAIQKSNQRTERKGLSNGSLK